MTLLSKLKPLLKSVNLPQNTAVFRQMSEHRIFPLEPSRWQWTKFKDLIHFYLMLGLIPCGLFVGYQNMFTGPATLSEIPERYVPKYWEYYKNPVTRLVAKYLCNDPQQDYEKFCCYLFTEHEKLRLRELETKIIDLISERKDYQAYYYQPVATKYYRIVKEGSDAVINLSDPVSGEP